MITEIVDSPDDGGFWISQFDGHTEKSRASEQIFKTKEAAVQALKDDTVKWEAWS